MKIAIDTQTTLGQKTGFGYYVENLVRLLSSNRGQFEYQLIKPNTPRDFSAPQRFIWDQWILPRQAQAARVDLLHQPAFSVPVSFAKPVVVTVHDLIAVRFGADIPFWSRQYFGRWMPFSYRFANHIISVSEHTKQDIVELLNIPKEKITVIPLALDRHYHNNLSDEKISQVKRRYRIAKDYLLYIGTINPRKNLLFLVEVFSQLSVRFDIQLIIVGKKGWYFDKLINLINDLGLKNKVVLTDYISDSEKIALMRDAKIFAFPSLYEGFGLPILEALSAGVPVVASNRSSIPEVLGGAGLLLDPSDQGVWVKEITALLRSPGRREKMKQAGQKRVKEFSWEKTAAKTIEVYRAAFDNFRKGSR